MLSYLRLLLIDFAFCSSTKDENYYVTLSLTEYSHDQIQMAVCPFFLMATFDIRIIKIKR